MSASGEAIDLTIPATVPHIVIRRERQTTDGKWLYENVHIYFSDSEPVVEIDRGVYEQESEDVQV